VKVMVRICPSQGIHDTSESMSFLKVDPRKKQITLYDPPTCGPTMTGHRRAVVAVPKMFAFDSVFPQDASQAEVCSGTVAEVIQSVVNGADGCIFCFGHVKLGYNTLFTTPRAQNCQFCCSISDHRMSCNVHEDVKDLPTCMEIAEAEKRSLYKESVKHSDMGRQLLNYRKLSELPGELNSTLVVH
ncbi:hypothetical protein AB205_0150390, partial [Aquarana catesbeiana]